MAKNTDSHRGTPATGRNTTIASAITLLSASLGMALPAEAAEPPVGISSTQHKLESQQHKLNSQQHKMYSQQHKMDSMQFKLDSQQHKLDSQQHKMDSRQIKLNSQQFKQAIPGQ